MQTIETESCFHIAIVWVHHTLVVIGVLAVMAFIKVNFFETDIEIEPMPVPKIQAKTK